MLTSPKFRNSQRLQAAARNSPLLKSPEQGEAVRLLQEALLSLGYSFPQSTSGGRLDGIYGNETTQKVAQFQRAQGMMVDGVAGKQTLERLDALISGGAPATQPGGAGAGWGQPAGGQGGAWGERVGGGGGSGSGAGGAGSAGQPGVDPRHSGLYIRMGTAVVCPHHGRVVASVIPGTDLISGSSGAMVMGCVGFDWRTQDRRPAPDGSVPETPLPYGPPISYIMHCRSARWTNVDYRNLVNGHPPVLRTSPGYCYLEEGAKINGSNVSGPILVISG